MAQGVDFEGNKQMIRISDKKKCTGCTACVAACPAQCIVMRRDRQGFDYPVANPDMCVDCGKCTAVCPVLNPMSATEPMTAYAAKLPQYIGGSSSGGVFPALAKEVVDECGDRKSTRLNSSHKSLSRMPSSA